MDDETKPGRTRSPKEWLGYAVEMALEAWDGTSGEEWRKDPMAQFCRRREFRDAIRERLAQVVQAIDADAHQDGWEAAMAAMERDLGRTREGEPFIPGGR